MEPLMTDADFLNLMSLLRRIEGSLAEIAESTRSREIRWVPPAVEFRCNCPPVGTSGSCPFHDVWGGFTTPSLPAAPPTGSALSCAKCLGADIHTTWHAGLFESGSGQPQCSWGDQIAEGQTGEHLHRYCRTCRYQWRDPVAGG
jgi:hypothetical protein